MSDQDNTQVTNQPTEQNAPAEEHVEKTLAEELAAANDKTTEEETPENQPAEQEQPKLEEPEKPADPIEEPVKPETDEEKETRRRNYEQAQKRIQERERKQLEQNLAQQHQAPKVSELTQHFLDQGYDQFQAEMLARDEARNQEMQLSQARTQAAELTMRIETEALQVMHEYPIFDPKSPSYDKDFASRVNGLYSRVSGLHTDPKTNAYVAAAITPYEFFKEQAEMHQSGMSQAQVKAQKAAEAQMAAAAPATSTPPPVSKSTEDDQADRMRAAFDNA